METQSAEEGYGVVVSMNAAIGAALSLCSHGFIASGINVLQIGLNLPI